MSEQPWCAVRCIFVNPSSAPPSEPNTYEERITLWRAQSFEEAIERAERDAAEYAEALAPCEYTGSAQAYHLPHDGAPVGDGTEIFSLTRDSDLEPDDYVTRFFDTGTENRRDVE
jgi:hypothetical protein